MANLGDSRAVASLGGMVKQLTSDHNTSSPRERERVTAMGGVIKDNRVGGVLIPTRLVKGQLGKRYMPILGAICSLIEGVSSL